MRYPPSMDVLSEILGILGLRGSLYFTTEFRPPWGVKVPTFSNVARFHLVVRGRCWVRIGDSAAPVELETGDLILIPHGADHALTSAADSVCLTVDEVVEQSGFTGEGILVHGGDDAGEPTRLVCGHFAFDPGTDHPFLRQLPSQILIRHDEFGNIDRGALESVLRIIAREVRDVSPGGEAVVHRLSEVLFIQAIRIWARSQPMEEGLVGALLDRHLGASLEVLHGAPEYRWSLEELARHAGLSRTVFAQRFHQMVGMPPMQYLATWRVQKARDLLAQMQLSLDAVAQAVGYASTAAFSRVFKRTTGISPGAFRRAQAPPT